MVDPKPQLVQKAHGNVHHPAKHTSRGREAMVPHVIERGCSYRATPRAFEVDTKVVHRWVACYREAGTAGLVDRSSRQFISPRRTPKTVERHIVELRRHHLIMATIAAEVGIG